MNVFFALNESTFYFDLTWGKIKLGNGKKRFLKKQQQEIIKFAVY